MFRGNILCFSLCPLLLVRSLGITEKSLALSSQSLRYSYVLMRPSQASSTPGCTVSALSAFPHRKDTPVPSPFSRPFAGLVPVVSHVSWIGEPITRYSTPGVALPRLSREGWPYLTCWQHFLTQPRILLVLFEARVHWRFIFSVLSTRTPMSFSAKLLSHWSASSTY